MNPHWDARFYDENGDLRATMDDDGFNSYEEDEPPQHRLIRRERQPGLECARALTWVRGSWSTASRETPPLPA